jgi:hypothetical protein
MPTLPLVPEIYILVLPELDRDVALVLKYKSLAEPSNKFSPLDDTKAKLSKSSSPIKCPSPSSI